MKSIKNWIIENSFYVFLVSTCVFGMFVYISVASANVPIMDYWKYADGLIEKNYTGGISYIDLCSYNGVHKTPLQLLFFLLNVEIFNWNTQISMYFGIIVSCISLFLIYKMIAIYSCNKRSQLVSNITCTVITFSLIPYEIITQEFAFTAAIGILLFLLGAFLINKVLHSLGNKYDKRAWIVVLYMFFVINIFGGAFSVAFALSILLIEGFDFSIKLINKISFNKANYVIIFVGIILSLFLYFNGIELGTGNSANDGVATFFIDLIKGAILICGTSLIGAYQSKNLIIVIGIIELMIHFILFILYVKNKMYKKTYIPAIFYFYYGIVYGMLFIGRTGQGVDYLMAPRYAKEAIFVVIADIIVVNLAFELYIKNKKKFRIMQYSFLVLIVMITGCILEADIKEVHIASNRRIYCDNLITMMENIDNYSDDELGVFQAGNPQRVRNGVNIMKKYNLGIFNK